MPEGPELYLAARYVNKTCKNLLFNKIAKSEISKKQPVAWESGTFGISAVSRGKELAFCLKAVDADTPMKFIFFHFGMSGNFKLTSTDEIPKHSHLRFYTVDQKRVLNFVDVRRFGGWKEKSELCWDPARGPDPLTEYEEFRVNVLKSLDDKVFQKPLCEVLLDQRYFNGIGNYLRAEVMHKAKAAPFSKAVDCLMDIKPESDILSLCNSVQQEIIDLELTPYANLDGEADNDWSRFTDWCQVYMKNGSKYVADKNGRTVWFTGEAGPLLTKTRKVNSKVTKVQKKKNTAKVATDNEAKMKKEVKKEDVEIENPAKSKVARSKKRKNEVAVVKRETEEGVEKKVLKKEVKDKEDVKGVLTRSRMKTK